MGIELLIAPEGGGKTQTCIERIRAARQDDPLKPVWVLVPNAAAMAQIKTRLAAAGAAFGVRVGFFQHFYRELLEGTGRFVPTVSPALSHRLVQETVREASAAGELGHYDAIKDKPGFLAVLVDAFAELRSARVEPKEFLEYTRADSPKRRELGGLYARFLTRLGEIGWSDSEGLAWLAIEAIAEEPELAGEVSLVAADGFISFTRAQREFLGLLGRQAGGMIVTLPGEGDCERLVHRRTRKVLEQFERDVARSGDLRQQNSSLTPLPPSPAGRDARNEEGVVSGREAIGHMERYLFESGEVGRIEVPEPFMLEARSQAEEAREALRWLKRLHLREGVRLEECALFCANLETYQPLLRAAADEFGMKIHFSQREPLLESPAILAMLNLLALPVEDYPIRRLLNVLHSPYFEFGLSEKDVEDLEKVAHEAIIVTGREQWDSAWTILGRKARGSEQDLDEERSVRDLTTGIDLAGLQARLEPFWEVFDGLRLNRSQAGWIEWLEGVLGGSGFYDRVETERDRAACKAMGEALRALVVSEKVVGVAEIGYGQFLADLQSAMRGAGLEEERTTRRNAVFAGKLVEARAARYRAVVLLGLSEGLFPVVENPDPFLDEELRGHFGLESRLGRDQASTFYQAVTRSDAYLLLTRPYLSEDGERWEPSPHWLATAKLFGESARFDKKALTNRPQSEAASGEELLFWGVQTGKLDYPGDQILNERWQNIGRAHGVLDARRAKRAEGRFEGDLTSLAGTLAREYSAAHVWSCSRLEAYGDCPYRFFAGSVLGLEEQELPEPGLDIAQIGSLNHRILELVYSQAVLAGADPLEILNEVAQKVFETAPVRLGFRPTALWEVEKRQHLENLRASLEAMEAERGGWQPFAFERKFGIKDTPCLELQIDGEVIRLRGVIDRVDRNPDGEIRVIDYKTGGSMNNSDLVDGKRLQLPVYARAAQDALNLGDVTDGYYWVINAGKPSSLTLAKFKSDVGVGIRAADKIAKSHILNNVSGVRSGNFKAATPKGGCVEWCPARLWCWRYQARFKNA